MNKAGYRKQLVYWKSLSSVFVYLMFKYLQFASLEEFQEEFKDINQEEQISRLHKMLAPHLLRRKNLKLFFLIQLYFI